MFLTQNASFRLHPLGGGGDCKWWEQKWMRKLAHEPPHKTLSLLDSLWALLLGIVSVHHGWNVFFTSCMWSLLSNSNTENPEHFAANKMKLLRSETFYLIRNRLILFVDRHWTLLHSTEIYHLPLKLGLDQYKIKRSNDIMLQPGAGQVNQLHAKSTWNVFKVPFNRHTNFKRLFSKQLSCWLPYMDLYLWNIYASCKRNVYAVNLDPSFVKFKSTFYLSIPKTTKYSRMYSNLTIRRFRK